MRRNGWLLVAIALVVLCPIARADALPGSITLTDDNSTVVFDTNMGDPMGWWVDGTRLMWTQAFLFRVGNEGGETNINRTTLTGAGVLNNNIGLVSFASGDLTFNVSFILTGGTLGSGLSDLAETIEIKNTGSTPLDVHFFEFVNFDLSPGSGEGGQQDVVWLRNDNAVDQTGTMGRLSETVVTPAPDAFRVGGCCLANYGFPYLLGSDPDGATNLPLLALGDRGPFGPGDQAWAFQWDFTLGAGVSEIISKDKRLSVIVPEPASILGLGTVLFLLGSRLRRKRA